jgi:hypothetical protein
MSRHRHFLPPPPPELSIYRNHCIALLRRYFCMSVEVGRLPAILGREVFTARSQDFYVHSFEDTVLFVIDVEHCLDRLPPFDKELIAHIVLQEYTEEETARLLHCCARTVRRRLPDALDCLTEMLLRRRMLNLSEEICRGLVGSECVPDCAADKKQRTTHVASLHASGEGSRLEIGLVKPPFSPKSLQPVLIKPNRVVPDVAGLPPAICYAGLVS